MPVRHAHPQALPPWSSPPRPSHVGCGPGLVDEDQPLRVEVELLLKPSLALPQDVGPLLLGCVRRLFFTVMLRRRKKRHRPP